MPSICARCRKQVSMSQRQLIRRIPVFGMLAAGPGHLKQGGDHICHRLGLGRTRTGRHVCGCSTSAVVHSQCDKAVQKDQVLSESRVIGHPSALACRISTAQARPNVLFGRGQRTLGISRSGASS